MRLEMSGVGEDEGAAAGTGRAKYGDDDDDDDDMVVDGEGGRGAGPHNILISIYRFPRGALTLCPLL